MKAIVFDADHTLYNPKAERAYEKKFDFLSEETGVEKRKLEEAWKKAATAARQKTEPQDRGGMVREALSMEGVEPDDDTVERCQEIFWDVVVSDIEYEDGVEDILRNLQQRMDWTAVTTNEFPGPLEKKMSRVFQDHRDLFDRIVTPKDTGETKPSERFYRMALDGAEVDFGDVVAVGDSWKRDLKPADELGMTTVLVNSSKDDNLAAETGSGDPDYRIDRISELVKVV
ncbi:MAG: HAD family hydrolase [Candidatus Nanohaloarchaea archaeon]|nr:HAD family hydrolase [Candidatus Nanohaloarchaea archaeon]